MNTILITGGTGRIGVCLTKHFLHQEGTVVITSRRELTPQQISDLFGPASPGRFHLCRVDLETENAAAIVVEYLDRHNLRPQALVNNARDLDHLKLDDRGRPSRAGWLGEYTLDVVAAYELSMALTEQPGSKLETIINISSMNGVVVPTLQLYDDAPRQSPLHYGVAKAALIHLSKELAVRLADRHIRVNTISYGGVEGRVNEEFKKRYAQFCPLGRMLTDDDLAGPVEFLATPASSGVTGHNLVVDGGWTIR
ncbi:MAG: SDR family oxidoreductase [candidate division Zixibacteria bacterium]|nr:SDR family oxidoreductase [candidate division Zixibacteria bacterium]